MTRGRHRKGPPDLGRGSCDSSSIRSGCSACANFKVVELITGKVKRTWGEKEAKRPTRTHYVKYTQNYMSRAEVNFDAGTVLVETVDEVDPRASLRSAIVTTLLTPDDPARWIYSRTVR